MTPPHTPRINNPPSATETTTHVLLQTVGHKLLELYAKMTRRKHRLRALQNRFAHLFTTSSQCHVIPMHSSGLDSSPQCTSRLHGTGTDTSHTPWLQVPHSKRLTRTCTTTATALPLTIPPPSACQQRDGTNVRVRVVLDTLRRHVLVSSGERLQCT